MTVPSGFCARVLSVDRSRLKAFGVVCPPIQLNLYVYIDCTLEVGRSIRLREMKSLTLHLIHVATSWTYFQGLVLLRVWSSLGSGPLRSLVLLGVWSSSLA